MSPTLQTVAWATGIAWAVCIGFVIVLAARYNRNADGTRRAHVDRKADAIRRELYPTRDVQASQINPPVSERAA